MLTSDIEKVSLIYIYDGYLYGEEINLHVALIKVIAYTEKAIIQIRSVGYIRVSLWQNLIAVLEFCLSANEILFDYLDSGRKK